MNVCRTGVTEAVAGSCWDHATQGVGAETGRSPRDIGIPGVCTCSEKRGGKAGRNRPVFMCWAHVLVWGLYIHGGHTHTHTHTHTHLIALLQSKVFWRRVTGESESLTAGAAAV